MGQDNLAKYPYLTTSAEIRLATHHLGLPQAAPFDRIIVSGQIREEWLPLLIAQLSPNDGTLIVPIASETSHGRPTDLLEPVYDQKLVIVVRTGDEVTTDVITEDIDFVPIVYEPTNGQKTLLAQRAILGSVKRPD